MLDAEAACAALSAKDPALAALMARVGPFRLEREPESSPFEALARAIIYQQLSGKAAATIHGRLIAGVGGALTPETLLATPDEALRAAGVSRPKQLALRDLATKTIEGVVPPLAVLEGLDDAAIIERLTAVRGVGRWTVEMLLIFRLGRPDVLPIDDLGVRKGVQRTYGLSELIAPKMLATFGERWRPYRSVASWYMWRSLELPAGS